MDEVRAHARLVTTTGRDYGVVETVDQIGRELADARSGELLEFKTVTGQVLFPPERLVIRADQVALVQEVSDESWAWMKRANELHYARQLQNLEETPYERVAAAQEQLVKVLSGEDEVGE